MRSARRLVVNAATATTALTGLLAAAAVVRDGVLVLVLLTSSVAVAAFSLASITEASGAWRAARRHRRAAIAIASVPVVMLAAGFIGATIGVRDVGLSYLQIAIGGLLLGIATIAWPSVAAIRTALLVTWATGLAALGLLGISDAGHPSRLVGTVGQGAGDAAVIVLVLVGCVVASFVVAVAQTVLIALARLRDRADGQDSGAIA